MRYNKNSVHYLVTNLLQRKLSN